MNFRFLSFLLSALIPGSWANDSSVSFLNSGVQYVHNPDIEMQQEDLTITQDQITVEYSFFNTHSKDIILNMGFPLPASPNFEQTQQRSWKDAPYWDPVFQTYDYADIFEGYKGDDSDIQIFGNRTSRPFFDFHCEEDGEGKYVEWKIVALDRQGNDLTSLLQRNKIPPSANYLNGVMNRGGMDCRPALKEKLAALGLVKKGKVDFQTQLVFHWTTTFPAKKIKKILHHYNPQAGSFIFAIAKGGSQISPGEGGELERHFDEYEKLFIDLFAKEKNQRPLLKQWIEEGYRSSAKASEPWAHLSVHQIRYILTTGKNWKGPIGRFNLKIPIPSQTEVFVHGIKGLEKKDGAWQVTIDQFAPTQELTIFYVTPLK
jgi:hypothetical protein